MKLKNTELKKAFEELNSDQLSDYKFLSNFIFEKAGLVLNTRKLNITEDKNMDCWGGVQSRQYPDEVGKLLAVLYKNKDMINSFCEIGIDKGGTFYIIDSFLRAINQDMGKSVGLDRNTKILSCGFEEYKNENPNAHFVHMNSSNFEPDQNYDFCFIDGEHQYPGCKNDFEKMKNFSNLIALHDIYFYDKIFINGGVKRLWQEIDGYKKEELLNEDDRFPVTIGIGVVFIKDKV
jgi:hypothetical protein